MYFWPPQLFFTVNTKPIAWLIFTTGYRTPIFMNENEQLINRFYTAFQQLDYTTMQNCYSEGAVFNDPVFGLLQGAEVKAMWEMLCKNAKNFTLQFSNIQLLDEEYASCNW